MNHLHNGDCCIVMPVSGLLITLTADERLAAEVVQRLQPRGEILLGERQQRWLPVAVDGRDETHSRELHDWISRLPGVAFVDVISVHFEEAVDAPRPCTLEGCEAA